MERHPAAHGLVERLELGLRRGVGVLIEEEHEVVGRALALSEGALLGLARLSGRRTTAWRLPELSLPGVEAPEGALEELEVAGLATRAVAWGDRLAHATRPVLQAGCRRLGLGVGGAREALVERLRDVEGWDDAPWVTLTCAPLLLRVERMATLRLWPDRSVEVLERLGVRRWAAYTPCGCGLAPSREAWLAWEAMVDGLDGLDVPALMAALDLPWWPPGGLDLRHDLARRVGDLAAAAERAGAHADAAVAWTALVDRGWWLEGEAPLRLARLHERAGRAQEGLALLRRVHGATAPAVRRSVERGAAALARRSRLGWAPSPPLREARARWLRWQPAGAEGPRPRWAAAGAVGTVEHVAIRVLAAAGRVALDAEGALWRTVVSLLLADAMFVPVPGMLPVPHLSGPLDAGTPAFAAARPVEVAAIREAVGRGEGPARVASAWDRWEGTRLRGVSWEAWPRDVLVAVVAAAGPGLVGAVLDQCLTHGDRVTAGMPDLVVLPGPEVRLEGGWPARVGPGLLFVEVKGPTDAVRDAQAVWHDLLAAAGAAVELWWVEASGPEQRAEQAEQLA